MCRRRLGVRLLLNTRGSKHNQVSILLGEWFLNGDGVCHNGGQLQPQLHTLVGHSTQISFMYTKFTLIRSKASCTTNYFYHWSCLQINMILQQYQVQLYSYTQFILKVVFSQPQKVSYCNNFHSPHLAKEPIYCIVYAQTIGMHVCAHSCTMSTMKLESLVDSYATNQTSTDVDIGSFKA